MVKFFRRMACWFGRHVWREVAQLQKRGFRPVPFYECERCRQTAVWESVKVGPRAAARKGAA